MRTVIWWAPAGNRCPNDPYPLARGGINGVRDVRGQQQPLPWGAAQGAAEGPLAWGQALAGSPWLLLGGLLGGCLRRGHCKCCARAVQGKENVTKGPGCQWLHYGAYKASLTGVLSIPCRLCIKSGHKRHCRSWCIILSDVGILKAGRCISSRKYERMRVSLSS